MKRIAVLAVTVGFSTSAFAGPPGRTEPAGLPPSETLPISYAATPDEKNGATAVALSVGGLLGGFALGMGTKNIGVLGLAVIVGPSAGRWYNHEIGGIGLVARTAGAVAVLNWFGGIEDSCEGWYSEEDCAAVERKQDRAEKLALAGVGLVVASTLYDFMEAGQGSERYNKKHRVTVTPTATTNSTGVAISGSF